MSDLYANLKGLGKKKRLYIALGIASSSLCLAAILLLYFLHPRSQTAIYCALAIIVLVLWICLSYYLFLYKLGHLRAIASFLKTKPQSLERENFAFLEESESYLRKLGFRKLVFLDEKGEQTSLLLLSECQFAFKQGQTYELGYYKDKLYECKEKEDEKA
jgi:hypothetical protein